MALPATRPTGAIPAGAVLSSDQLLEIYYYLRLTRTLEERLVALYRQTKVIGGLFRSLGQEGESVASAYALERGRHKDVLSPLIRNLGSLLVMGARPVEILRQYMAKADSPTRGRELNVHFNDLEKGYLGQISHLGDMIPVMAGIALSFKLRGEPRVGLVYIGDGGTSTGTFHEGLNLAAVRPDILAEDEDALVTLHLFPETLAQRFEKSDFGHHSTLNQSLSAADGST